ncbi:MAG: hypothetical protein O6942_04140 [Bacteroidetes bacterium]|nr:hypothetical protein [Bacteroidota bacterium]
MESVNPPWLTETGFGFILWRILAAVLGFAAVEIGKGRRSD